MFCRVVDQSDFPFVTRSNDPLPQCEVCGESCETSFLMRCCTVFESGEACEKFCHSYCAGHAKGLPDDFFCHECSEVRPSLVFCDLDGEFYETILC